MDDLAVIEAQIGRPARGGVSVAVRCEYGLPMVIRTSPFLDDGSPFPTLYWLACPLAVRKAGAMEHGGSLRGLTERLGSDAALAAEYSEAHDRYRRDRDGSLDGNPDSAGGMPVRVKCLHALYAHELADANPIGAIVRREVEPLGCPGPCVAEAAGGGVERVPNHPGLPRGRRR